MSFDHAMKRLGDCLRSPIRHRSLTVQTTTTIQNDSFKNWNGYLNYRNKLKSYKRIFGISGALTSLPLNYFYLSTPLLDPTKLIFGVFDANLFIMLSFVTLTGISYFGGEMIPTCYLRLCKRQFYDDFNRRTKVFYHKITQNRTNVISSNPSTFASGTDYYGEKIASVSGYRQWLRRQHALKNW